MPEVNVNRSIPALLLLGLVLVFFQGCAARSPEEWLSRHQIEFPGVDKLIVCVSYGCRYIETTSLDPQEWEKVMDTMEPGYPDTPEEERRRISETIGLLERIIGPKVGTEHNKGRNRGGPPGSRQMDCIADSVNTTTYLLLLSSENLLKDHQVVQPVRKGPLSLSFWHHSAVIQEKDSDRRFAVDPWFYDNGHPAAVIPLDDWISGDYPFEG